MHGGIDGYSRLITFMQCSNNNRSRTVLHYFVTRVQCYGIPERIRTDRGGENTQVGRYAYAKYKFFTLCTQAQQGVE